MGCTRACVAVCVRDGERHARACDLPKQRGQWGGKGRRLEGVGAWHAHEKSVRARTVCTDLREREAPRSHLGAALSGRHAQVREPRRLAAAPGGGRGG